jgi:hypothetical protein
MIVARLPAAGHIHRVKVGVPVGEARCTVHCQFLEQSAKSVPVNVTMYFISVKRDVVTLANALTQMFDNNPLIGIIDASSDRNII